MLTNVKNVNYLYHDEVATTHPGHYITHCNSSPSLNSLKCNQEERKVGKIATESNQLEAVMN